MNADELKRLEELFQQWSTHSLPEAQQDEFFELLRRADQQQALPAWMQKAWEQTETETVFSPVQKEAMLQKIMRHRKAKTFTLRYAAVAAAVLLVAALTVVLFLNKKEKTNSLAKTETAPPPRLSDIQAPSANKAILTLANGQQIVLENAGNGALATEGNIKVIKLTDGRLVYSGNSTEIKYNTLTVPRGSKPVQLTLADGSTATLNVASSITYPTAFSGADRKVSITGEVYFEVAHAVSPQEPAQKLPFLVNANGVQVEVLGTHFNVNAYSDEDATKTTLLEGAVKIRAGHQQQMLAPGQQALVTNGPGADHPIRLVKNADVDEAMAWLNGKFRFHNAGVETVMRQVARWYDVEVNYAAKPTLRFGGQIDRSSTLRQMFTILETSGLHFSLSGKRVTVLP